MATSQTSEPLPLGAPLATPAHTPAATVVRPPLLDPPASGAVLPGDERGHRLRRLLLCADVAALCLGFALAEAASGSPSPRDLPVLILGIPVWVLLAYAHRLYHLDSYRTDYRASDELGPVLQMTTVWSWLTLLALPLVGTDGVPIGRVALFWILAVLLLTSLRSAVRAYAREQPWYVQNALVVGPPDQTATIIRRIDRHPEWRIHATAHNETEHDASVIADVRRLGVDRVMLAPALSDTRRRATLVGKLGDLGVHVDLIPSWSDTVGARLELHQIEGMPLLTVPRPRMGRSSLRLKRMLDLAASSVALVLLAPLIAVLAVAIKLDTPGPVFFRQRRIGRGDQPFELLKFRSMCANADRDKETVAALNIHGGGTATGMFKIRGDPRVTRVGAFLRRYSLDELPQIINIVRGEMSFVGPRPLIESEDRQVEGRYRRRLGITPGLTGLWQANGRSEIPFDEMMGLDYVYAMNWSLWGDVKLLMRTVWAFLRGRGA